jgi:DNA-binding Lrp family transcriptional regulator
MRAYIFVATATKANPRQIAQEMRRIAGVSSADICWGVPDIIALAEASDMKGLETVVVDQVQKIAGVDKTDTHIVAGS